MAVHLLRDLEHLKEHLLYLGSLVEESTDKAIASLLDRNADLAREVIEGDDRIDAMEVKVEEEAMKLLALHQPVAADLRFIITVLKVNNDLERVGDLAVNIGARAIDLADDVPLGFQVDFADMCTTVRSMVHDCLESLVRQDVAIARRVWTADGRVDRIHREMFGAMEDVMRQDKDCVRRATLWLSASRHLERIADLATNIAEDVIFMVKGEVVRHRDAI
ncbi:MAG: phosphate signaling complex protein PhoU [Planctomycetes bacterium]|nr:phosphate signaling complex protein PhoU [Planctomycetota bacterium]